MDVDPHYTIAMLLTVGGVVGGRLFYVLEHGSPLLGNRGFTLDGGHHARESEHGQRAGQLRHHRRDGRP